MLASLKQKFTVRTEKSGVIIQKGKRQYRSALFYVSEEQHETAKHILDLLQKSAAPDYDAVFSDVESVAKFVKAEESHQEFLAKRMVVAQKKE